MTYLVTGATGKAGRHVVDHLLRAGHPVRALTRDPARAAARLPAGVEVVAGDLTRPDSLEPALAGVTGLHLLTAAGEDYATLRTGPRIVELAREAGVRRVTVLWNGAPGPVEEAVADSDLEWTRLQPVDFMGNTLGWADDIRTGNVVREPFGDALNAVVDEYDVGAVAAAVLTGDGHAGRAYTLTGPAALSARDQVRVIAATIGADLRFVELSEEQARQRWRDAGHGEELVDLLLAWRADPPAAAYTVVPTVAELLGRPPRGYATWVAEHAAAFR
jgi:uncharacterized protein YbjT (DUF2867 family)